MRICWFNLYSPSCYYYYYHRAISTIITNNQHILDIETSCFYYNRPFQEKNQYYFYTYFLKSQYYSNISSRDTVVHLPRVKTTIISISFSLFQSNFLRKHSFSLLLIISIVESIIILQLTYFLSVNKKPWHKSSQANFRNYLQCFYIITYYNKRLYPSLNQYSKNSIKFNLIFALPSKNQWKQYFQYE